MENADFEQENLKIDFAPLYDTEIQEGKNASLSELIQS